MGIFPTNVPWWNILIDVLLIGITLVSVIAIFKWKKWGFWTFGAVSVFSFAFTWYISKSWWQGYNFFDLVNIAILYWALHIGGNNRGWPRLH